MHWLSPVLAYGSEIWTLRQKGKQKFTSLEMGFFGRTAETHFLTPREVKKFRKS